MSRKYLIASSLRSSCAEVFFVDVVLFSFIFFIIIFNPTREWLWSQGFPGFSDLEKNKGLCQSVALNWRPWPKQRRL